MMAISRINKLLAALACLSCAAAAPSMAASSAASSASESIGFSIGSISGSLKTSSGSSARPTDVAEGDYRVVDIAAIDDRPGDVRITLRAIARPTEAGEVQLTLPQQAVDRGHLAQGHTVTARQRPYGVEFSSGEPRESFFLVLGDDWYRELRAHAVAL